MVLILLTQIFIRKSFICLWYLYAANVQRDYLYFVHSMRLSMCVCAIGRHTMDKYLNYCKAECEYERISTVPSIFDFERTHRMILFFFSSLSVATGLTAWSIRIEGKKWHEHTDTASHCIDSITGMTVELTGPEHNMRCSTDSLFKNKRRYFFPLHFHPYRSFILVI